MTLARGEMIRFCFSLTDHHDEIDETDIRYRMSRRATPARTSQIYQALGSETPQSLLTAGTNLSSLLPNMNHLFLSLKSM